MFDLTGLNNCPGTIRHMGDQLRNHPCTPDRNNAMHNFCFLSGFPMKLHGNYTKEDVSIKLPPKVQIPHVEYVYQVEIHISLLMGLELIS